jgi:addiction module HigA family antidote
MARMHNPPHPGEVLREYLGELTVSDVAAHIGVSRATLQRILSGAASVSADMAYRLGAALGTSPDLWAGIQLEYDLYHAGKMKRPKIGRLLPALTLTP